MSASETSIVAELPPIVVTRHAQDRARQRHPEFWRTRGVDGMYADVRDALRTGRRAKTSPRWARIDEAAPRRKAMKRYGTGLYVWNREETRCYALRRGQTRRGPGWVVKTIIGQESRERAA